MTLTAALQDRSDEDLVALLRARPDLLVPGPPASWPVLLNRLTAWPSIAHCLEGLDRFSHHLLAGLCLLPAAATADEVADVLGSDEAGVSRGEIAAGLERLLSLGLCWVATAKVNGADNGGRGASGAQGSRVVVCEQLRRALPRPAGLGAPLADLLSAQPRTVADAIARNLGLVAAKGRPPKKSVVIGQLGTALRDPARVEEVVASAPKDAQAFVAELAGSGATRIRSHLHWYGQQPRGPLEWLASRGLLASAGWGVVEVPREVGLALRGGRPFPDLAAHPPPLATEPVAPEPVAAAVAGAATDVMAGIESACAEWGQRPAALLKAGGVGARDLKRVARRAEREESEAPLLAELALAAGLLAVQGGEVLPTPAFDQWMSMAPAERWLAVVRGWLASNRWPTLAGQRDLKDKKIPALHPRNQANQARDQRAAVLAAIAAVPEGRAAVPASLAHNMVWLAPRRWEFAPAPPEVVVSWVLAEAAAIGVTGAGELSPPARALLAGQEHEAQAAAEALLPPPTTTVTLQADLTALATGSLHPTLASELHLAADVESKGAATVFRFSEASVRRALDAGRTADGILELLARHAAKGVPQPLAYLVTDVARRHGVLRVGPATSCLRCEDPALLARVVRSKRAQALGLRQLAPTVLMARAPVHEVLTALRGEGFLPAEEDADGAVLAAGPPARRAVRVPGPSHDLPIDPAPADLAQVIAKLRVTPGPAGVATMADSLRIFDEDFPDPDLVEDFDESFAEEPVEIVELLLGASAAALPVWIGLGDSGDELVEVEDIEDAVLYAHSVRTGRSCTFPLAAIQWAALDDQQLEARP